MKRCLDPRFLVVLVNLSAIGSSVAAITAGVLSDFQDGTVQGWDGGANPTHIASGGPMGADDGFLRIGGGQNMVSRNSGSSYSGVLDTAVTSFEVSLMRPVESAGSLEMRLVLFGPGTANAWTSSSSQIVVNDGAWRTYSFSTQEADLTQVRGSASYEDLIGAVDRVMIRHDPGTPSRGGSPADGTLGIDNVTAVPELRTALILVPLLPILVFRRRI